MRVAGGASITIEGGNITHACPGTFTVLAGHKSFLGPARVSYRMPSLPRHICKDCLLDAARSASVFASRGGDA